MKKLIIAAALGMLTATAAPAQTISLARARQIALSHVSSSQGVTSEKLKTRNGILVYEFDIETPGPGHQEIRIDANSGNVVANRHEDDLVGGTAQKVEHTADKAANKIAKTADKAARKVDHEADKVFKKDEYARSNVTVNEARARQIALSRFPGGKVKDIDLETENGIAVWEVDVDTVGKGHEELLIDAHTGAVLQQRYRK